MTPESLLSVALDARMTPDATRVALYYASLGEGQHEYDRDRLSELLEEAGEKRIRKALQRAERCGHLTRHRGGQHTDRFEFSPAQEGGEKLSPSHGAGEKPLSPPHEGAESPPTTTTTSTTTPPYVPPSDGLELVREYLGDETVETALSNGVITPVKLKGIIGLYGPKGMQTDRVMAGLSPPERRQALATAVMRMAMDAKQYTNPLFEKYLRRAITGGDTDGSNYRATGTDGRRDPRGTPGPSRGPDESRGQRFVREE